MTFKAEDMDLPPAINESAWREWCADRKERRKPLTKRAAILVMNKLLQFTHHEQAEAIRLAIEYGWCSVFPKKIPMGFIERHTDRSWRHATEDEGEYFKRISDRSWASDL